MTFAWDEFLHVARELAANPPPGYPVEGVRRTILGRAYYAAFGHARDYAEANLGFVCRGGPEDHGRLRDHLRRRRRSATADKLDSLRVWRNAADYDGAFLVPGLTTEQAVPLAVAAAEYVYASLPPPAAP